MAPAARANQLRNARAEVGRYPRWAPARDRAWQVIATLIEPAARVAVVGAGNGDSLPLDRIAQPLAELVLIDLDPVALARARRRIPRNRRGRVSLIPHDVTAGRADTALIAPTPADTDPAPDPLPGAPFDLVIGDLFYSQLLYPAMCDADLPHAERTERLAAHGPALVRHTVARLHASAPGGRVLHIDDPAAWWNGHPQPVPAAEVLALIDEDPDKLEQTVERLDGPRDTDPRHALATLGIPVLTTHWWHWPFAPGVDYLVRATLAG